MVCGGGKCVNRPHVFAVALIQLGSSQAHYSSISLPQMTVQLTTGETEERVKAFEEVLQQHSGCSSGRRITFRQKCIFMFFVLLHFCILILKYFLTSVHSPTCILLYAFLIFVFLVFLHILILIYYAFALLLFTAKHMM